MKDLAIAAHADYETLGCGGTLLKHRAAAENMIFVDHDVEMIKEAINKAVGVQLSKIKYRHARALTATATAPPKFVASSITLI